MLNGTVSATSRSLRHFSAACLKPHPGNQDGMKRSHGKRSIMGKPPGSTLWLIVATAFSAFWIRGSSWWTSRPYSAENISLWESLEKHIGCVSHSVSSKGVHTSWYVAWTCQVYQSSFVKTLEPCHIGLDKSDWLLLYENSAEKASFSCASYRNMAIMYIFDHWCLSNKFQDKDTYSQCHHQFCATSWPKEREFLRTVSVWLSPNTESHWQCHHWCNSSIWINSSALFK